MPAAATRPTGKRSKRGRFEGRPTKQTPQVVEKIANAIALGLADDEAASLAGVSDMTLTTWRRDPEFLGKIKNAVSARLAMRLSKIESGTDGWQGTAWLLERLYPTRFSKPEVQISVSNSFNQTVNALSITISAEEARQIEEEASESRAKVREMFARYRPALRGNGNAEGQRTTDIYPEPVKQVGLVPIVRKEGDERSSVFWSSFVSGSGERPVELASAIFVTKSIVDETVGRGLGQQALVAFKSEEPTVADVLAVIERLCGGPAGWQRLQQKANLIASP
jgi:hypothetical protein